MSSPRYIDPTALPLVGHQNQRERGEVNGSVRNGMRAREEESSFDRVEQDHAECNPCRRKTSPWHLWGLWQPNLQTTEVFQCRHYKDPGVAAADVDVPAVDDEALRNMLQGRLFRQVTAEVEEVVVVVAAAVVRMANRADANQRNIRRWVTVAVNHLSLLDTIEFFVTVLEILHDCRSLSGG